MAKEKTDQILLTTETDIHDINKDEEDTGEN